MKKSKFTESQIVAILKEADAGIKVADVWRTVQRLQLKIGTRHRHSRNETDATTAPGHGLVDVVDS